MNVLNDLRLSKLAEFRLYLIEYFDNANENTWFQYLVRDKTHLSLRLERKKKTNGINVLGLFACVSVLGA